MSLGSSRVLASCGTEFLLLWCYGSLCIAAHNMLMGVMAVMGPPPHNSHITAMRESCPGSTVLWPERPHRTAREQRVFERGPCPSGWEARCVECESNGDEGEMAERRRRWWWQWWWWQRCPW